MGKLLSKRAAAKVRHPRVPQGSGSLGLGEGGDTPGGCAAEAMEPAAGGDVFDPVQAL